MEAAPSTSPPLSAASDDDDDDETYRGGEAPASGDGAEEQYDAPDDEATQRTNQELEEEEQHIILSRLLGPGKELEALAVKVPYVVGESGSSRICTVGRNADVNIRDERRASDKQFVSRKHTDFISKQSGMYIRNVGLTGTFINDRLLGEGEEVLLKHGNTITFGRDNTAPGQMLPYDGLKFRVSFPDGPDSIGKGRHSRRASARPEEVEPTYEHVQGTAGQEMAYDASRVAQRLLAGLGRAQTHDQVRAVTGTAVNELTNLAQRASRAHKAAKREAGGYQAKARAAGAATAAAQAERREQASAKRGKQFHSKKRPQGHISNTADKRAKHATLSGMIQKKPHGKKKRGGKGGGRRAS